MSIIQAALDPLKWQIKGKLRSKSGTPKDFKGIVIRAMVDRSDDEKEEDEKEVNKKPDTSHHVASIKDWQRNMFCPLVYHKAAILLAKLSGEEISLPDSSVSTAPLSFFNDLERRRVYTLALSTRKHRAVLSNVLEESAYAATYDWLVEQHPHTVLVMLLDFHEYKYRQKYLLQMCDLYETHLVAAVKEIQDSLFQSRIKVAASFARVRIEHCAATINDTLPLPDREDWKRTLSHPIYARVNTLLADRHEVYDLLKSDGFVRRGKGWRGVEEQPLYYQNDGHYKDLLVFPTHMRYHVYSTNAALQQKLVFQDKSVFVVGDIIASLLQDFTRQRKSSRHVLLSHRKTSRHMSPVPTFVPGFETLTEIEHVLLTHPDTGHLSSHICSLLKKNSSKLLICHGESEKGRQMHSMLNKLGAINYAFLPDAFADISSANDILKFCKIIICNPSCSKTAITNTVDFLATEELHKPLDDSTPLPEYIQAQRTTLAHALKIPSAQKVLYFTFSIRNEENEGAVKRILKKWTGVFEEISVIRETKVKVVENDEDVSACLTLPPSEFMDGCFIALLRRHQDAGDSSKKLAGTAGGKKKKTKKKKKAKSKGKPDGGTTKSTKKKDAKKSSRRKANTANI